MVYIVKQHKLKKGMREYIFLNESDHELLMNMRNRIYQFERYDESRIRTQISRLRKKRE